LIVGCCCWLRFYQETPAYLGSSIMFPLAPKAPRDFFAALAGTVPH